MGGAYAEPVDGAVIVFSCDSEKEVEEFVSKDPYHENGLVTEYSIREWTVVLKIPLPIPLVYKPSQSISVTIVQKVSEQANTLQIDSP